MAPGAPGLRPFYVAATTAMRCALWLLARWTVTGREAVPPGGPLIVAANHLSLVDPPLLAASIPRPITFLAKEELLRYPLVGSAIRAYGVVRVRRGRDFRDSMTRLSALLARDGVVGLFPEGTRSKGRGLGKARPGVALLALQSNAPILPVGIHGSERLGRPWAIFTRPRITVTIGEAFTLPNLEGPLGRAQLESLTDMIMCRIAAQLPPEYQGEYVPQPRKRASSPSP